MSFAQELRCSDPSLDGVIVNPTNSYLGNVDGEPFDLALFNNAIVRSVRLPETPQTSKSHKSLLPCRWTCTKLQHKNATGMPSRR
jgi:hypothetical protein